MTYCPRVCSRCGVSFNPTNSRTKTCSRSCGQTLRYGESKRNRICEVCGADYRATYSDQRTCGRTCGVKINRRVVEAKRIPKKYTYEPKLCRVHFLNCRVCQGVFCARRDNTPTCGADCCIAEWKRILRTHETRRAPRPRYCPCGIEIARSAAKCADCKAATRRARKQRDKRRRRALKLGVESEPYTLTEIALRDGGKCGLCGLKVRMDKVVPHPKAPTVDHVIPMARGGDDTRINVQLAHFLCISIKGANGGGEQLALIG